MVPNEEKCKIVSGAPYDVVHRRYQGVLFFRFKSNTVSRYASNGHTINFHTKSPAFQICTKLTSYQQNYIPISCTEFRLNRAINWRQKFIYAGVWITNCIVSSLKSTILPNSISLHGTGPHIGYVFRLSWTYPSSGGTIGKEARWSTNFLIQANFVLHPPLICCDNTKIVTLIEHYGNSADSCWPTTSFTTCP
jgi:hypothetical protein